MLKHFFSDEQYFPGWIGCPLAFADGACWRPYSMGIHRYGEGVRYENIWVRAGEGGMQLEMPWGRGYESQQAGERILASLGPK